MNSRTPLTQPAGPAGCRTPAGPCGDHDGKIIGVIGSVRDITDQKYAEQARRESEDRLKKIYDSVSVGIILQASDGTILETNGVAQKIFKLPSSRIMGKTSEDPQWQMVDEQGRPVEGRDHPSMVTLRTGQPMRNAVRGIFAGDPERMKWLLINTEPVTDPGTGRITHVLVTFSDITSLRKMQEDLKESEAGFRDIFNNSLDAILIREPFGHYLQVNDAACQKYGYTREEFLTKEPRDIVAPEIAPLVADRTQRILERGAEVFESVHRSRHGAEFFVELSSRFITYKGAPAILSTVRDITRHKEAEQRERAFREQEKMAAIGRVAGKMAHDFNNILGITLGASELLLTENLPEDIQMEVQAIKDSAIRGREITQNLMFFSKDQELKYSAIDLNEKVESVVRAMRSNLQGIKVNIDYGTGIDRVTVDEGLLNNALINLIQNAVHAMSMTQEPSLQIRSARHGARIVIEIQDNGCGIAPEHHDKIYEPSFTLKGSMDKTGAYSREIRGSGYGLANVKRAVDKHGGAIILDSASGRGATFRIELPVVEADLQPGEAETLPAPASVQPRSILVVEDEAHFGNILYRLLRRFGHKAHLAGTGRMAMDLLAENTYDAVSLDFILPDMNGMEVYRKIRNKDRNLPIIFVSGNFEFMQSMMDLKEQDPRVDHLAKPFTNKDYINKLHTWLE